MWPSLEMHMGQLIELIDLLNSMEWHKLLSISDFNAELYQHANDMTIFESGACQVISVRKHMMYCSRIQGGSAHLS